MLCCDMLWVLCYAVRRALMDLAIPKLRFAALSSLVKAFRPALSVRFVASLLGFIAAGGLLCSSGKS